MNVLCLKIVTSCGYVLRHRALQNNFARVGWNVSGGTAVLPTLRFSREFGLFLWICGLLTWVLLVFGLF